MQHTAINSNQVHPRLIPLKMAYWEMASRRTLKAGRRWQWGTYTTHTQTNKRQAQCAVARSEINALFFPIPSCSLCIELFFSGEKRSQLGNYLFLVNTMQIMECTSTPKTTATRGNGKAQSDSCLSQEFHGEAGTIYQQHVLTLTCGQQLCLMTERIG